MENAQEKIVWEAVEYERPARSADWFWGLGLLIVLGVILSLIFGNFLLAIIILLGGFVLIKQNKQEPVLTRYEVNDEGVRAGQTFYPYKNLDSFWVAYKQERPKLLLESKRSYMPLIDLPLGAVNPQALHTFLLKKLKAEEHEESVINLLADWLNL